MADKRAERFYLDMVRTLWAGFPPGIPSDGESPDFIWPGGALGVEVRRIFQQAPESGFPPAQVEGFQEKVVDQAGALYRKNGGPPVDVIINFSVDRGGIRAPKHLPQDLADFVRAKAPAQGQVTYYDAGSPDARVPTGISGINIASPMPHRPEGFWQGMRGGQTILLTRDLLANAIMEKNQLVASYRAKVSEVWLLLVSDLFPSSMCFGIPDEVDGWEFDFAFDGTLLLSREQARVWSLRRTGAGSA